MEKRMIKKKGSRPKQDIEIWGALCWTLPIKNDWPTGSICLKIKCKAFETFDMKLVDFETDEVCIPLDAIPQEMIKLTKNLKINKK